MILQAKNANPPILPTNLKFRHCLSSLKSSRQIFFHCCPCKCLFCCCHATAFFLLSCSGLTGASPGAFLSVIYCLTRRVRLDRAASIRITRSSRVMTVRKANRVITVNGNRHCKKPNGKIKRSVLPAEPRLHILERIHHTVGRRTPARLNSGIQNLSLIHI